MKTTAATGLVTLALVLAVTPLVAQERTMGLAYHDSTRSYQGYTLFAPMPYTVVYLIDNQGRLVHSWDEGSRPNFSAYLLEDGSLLHTGRVGGAGVSIRDWDNEERWSFGYSGVGYHRHHDVEMLPGGNVLMLASVRKNQAVALAAGRDPANLTALGLLTEYLVEVDTSNDEIVWEWHAWDHLVQDHDSTRQNYGTIRDHPELIDLNYGIGPGATPDDFIHANAVDYNARLDQVILSSRNYSEVWVIDHSTTTAEARGHAAGRYGRGGDLLYRWGNPAVYRRGDSLSHRLLFQHDAQWIPDSLAGAGHLLAFNNGSPDRMWSVVEEWVPPVDSPGFYHLGPDSACGPAAPTWHYRDTAGFYSSHISGAQRLPNGNTLICSGRWGTLFEVTPDSEVVWKYISPVGGGGPMRQGDEVAERENEVFRCYRYSPDYPAFQGRTLTPGDPIELPTVSVAEPGRVPTPARPVLDAARWVRDRAMVTLALPLAARVELAVYDLRGARVATLARGPLPAGNHRFTWDAATAAAGVYICRLRAGESTTSVKLLKPD